MRRCHPRGWSSDVLTPLHMHVTRSCAMQDKEMIREHSYTYHDYQASIQRNMHNHQYDSINDELHLLAKDGLAMDCQAESRTIPEVSKGQVLQCEDCKPEGHCCSHGYITSYNKQRFTIGIVRQICVGKKSLCCRVDPVVCHISGLPERALHESKGRSNEQGIAATKCKGCGKTSVHLQCHGTRYCEERQQSLCAGGLGGRFLSDGWRRITTMDGCGI